MNIHSYKTNQNARKSFSIFSFIAILISYLGLFSLAAHSVKKRTKEIGIRKVLGASVWDILTLIYKKYLLLVIIANACAIPIAYFLFSAWLTNFAYKTNMGILPFIAALLSSVGLTFAVVGYWAVKAAYSNPVDSIRVE